MRLLLEILEITSTFTFVTGLLLSILLLYLIRRFSTKDLGTYKYLLEAFTVYDTYIVIVHHITNPKVIPSHTGFGIISDRDYGFLPLLCFQSSCYAVPFALLNIHLLYRYWTINEFGILPQKIALFSQPKFIAALVSTAIFLQTTWFASCYYLGMPEDMNDVRRYQTYYRQEYGKDINEGPLLLNYWVTQFLISKPTNIILEKRRIVHSPSTLPYRRRFRGDIHRVLSGHNSHSHLSSDSKIDAHFRDGALLSPADTARGQRADANTSPLRDTPYFFNVTLPLFHIYSPTFSALSMVLVSCFPCIDAVVIIVLMKPYRQGLLRMLGMRKNKPNVVVAVSFTAETQVVE